MKISQVGEWAVTQMWALPWSFTVSSAVLINKIFVVLGLRYQYYLGGLSNARFDMIFLCRYMFLNLDYVVCMSLCFASLSFLSSLWYLKFIFCTGVACLILSLSVLLKDIDL